MTFLLTLNRNKSIYIQAKISKLSLAFLICATVTLLKPLKMTLVDEGVHVYNLASLTQDGPKLIFKTFNPKQP